MTLSSISRPFRLLEAIQMKMSCRILNNTSHNKLRENDLAHLLWCLTPQSSRSLYHINWMIKLCNCNFFDNGDDYKLRASRAVCQCRRMLRPVVLIQASCNADCRVPELISTPTRQRRVSALARNILASATAYRQTMLVKQHILTWSRSTVYRF